MRSNRELDPRLAAVRPLLAGRRGPAQPVSWQPRSQADWVIIALRHGDRCVLYASRTLTQVELQVHARLEDTFTYWPHNTVRVPTYVEATLEFYDFVTVTGASYSECLTKLFRMGEPGRWGGQEADTVLLDEAPQPQLPEELRALGPG